MHHSIRISLVLGITFILLSCGFLPAIGQDSPQNPPGGYDKGVWVLTNKTPYFMYPNSEDAKRFSVSGNSITVRQNWMAHCSPEGDRPAYYLGTGTWTELPSVLYPGTKLETIMTVSMEGNPAPCSDGSWGNPAVQGFNVNLHNNVIDNWMKVFMTWTDPKPAPNSQKVTWDVPWGTMGKTITIQMEFFDVHGRASVHYTYTYQEQKASTPASQSLITGIDGEKQPLNVKLVVYPEKTTDIDVIEIEAEVSGDYKSPLSYVWYKDNVKLEGETGYKFRLESGVLPGEYPITVLVTDEEGRTGEAWTTLNVVGGDTGIRGDVLEANLFDPIPNAIVSATSLKSGDTKTVKVGPDGKYFIHLMPGNYRVSASAPGYLTESGTFGDDVKVLSPHDEPYCIDCYTTFNFRLVMEPANGGKPCGTPWTEVFPDLNLNPCNVTMGPPVPTGSYMIWVSPVEGPMGSEPQDWMSYGPYQFRAKHYYSVVVKGDYGNSRVVVTEDDPETSCYESMPMPGYAYIYYRNDVISYRLLHYAMTICPVEEKS
jgi:hypothetical protein